MKRLFLVLVAAAGCTSLDTSKERAYPCTADSECRGGWVCGLEGRCHAAEPGPWLCSNDAGSASCFGWHCGLEGRCYSKDDGVARPCDFDRERDGGRDDCPTGWRCGRELLCHARGDVQAWSCESDVDCEGAWRCGPQRLCVDPTTEQPPLSPQLALTVERLAPAALRRRPDDIAGFATNTRRTYAWRTGLELTLFHHQVSGLPPYLTGTLQLDRLPDRIAATDSRIWVVSGSEVRAADLVDGGPVLSPPTDLGFVPQFARGGLEGLWLANAGDVVLFPNDGGGLVSFDAGLQPGEQILDLDGNTQGGGFAGAYLLTTTRVLRSTATGFGGQPFTSGLDGGFGMLPGEARRMFISGPFLALLDADGGTSSALLQGNAVQSRATYCPAACAGDGVPLRVVASASSGNEATWLCGTDAGTVLNTLEYVTCRMTTPPPDGRRWAATGDSAWADAWGRVGVQPPGSSSAVSTIGSAHIPPANVWFGAGYGRVVATNLLLFDAGMIAVPSGPVADALAGDPRLIIFASSVTGPVSSLADMHRVFAGITTNPTAVGQVQSANTGVAGVGAALRGAGRTVVIISNGDTLYSADLTAALAVSRSDAGPEVNPPQAVLAPRLAPSPRLPVLAVRGALSGPGAGHLWNGWALTTNRAVYFEALTERSWVDTPVSLPAGDWVTLVGDGNTVRVAYADGRLVTLPSRLDVAEPFPGGETSRQFAYASGVTFALADAGPLYLASNPDAGPRGVWRPISLPQASDEPGFTDGFDRGRLVEGEGHVFVVSNEWAVWRLTPDGGP